MYTMQLDTGATPVGVRLAGELTIYHARELRDGLLPLVVTHREVELDLSGVEDFDTAGVQVLLAGKGAAAIAGHSLRLVRHSRRVIEVFAAMNLSGFFGDPFVIPAGGY